MYDLWRDAPAGLFPDAIPEHLRELDLAELERLAGPEEEAAPPRPGARRILEWEFRFLIGDGAGEEAHPYNHKVRLRVRLADLQEDKGLTDEAAAYLAKLCGPRYDAATGVVLLTSDRFASRVSNHRHLVGILDKLVAEARRVFPS